MISLAENEDAIFSTILQGGFVSPEIITGIPCFEISFAILDLERFFSLKTEITFPSRSRRAIPVVVPGSIPTMRSFLETV